MLLRISSAERKSIVESVVISVSDFATFFRPKILIVDQLEKFPLIFFQNKQIGDSFDKSVTAFFCIKSVSLIKYHLTHLSSIKFEATEETSKFYHDDWNCESSFCQCETQRKWVGSQNVMWYVISCAFFFVFVVF